MAAARANWDTAGERGKAIQIGHHAADRKSCTDALTHNVDRVAARHGWVVQEVEALLLGGAELCRREGADARRKDEKGDSVSRSQGIHNHEAWALRARGWRASDIQ